jgi:hypothetical protein
VNADQTHVVYSAGSGTSWTETGQRQVSILGAEEKRAFTLLVGLTMPGEVLPPQAIYFGKSARSTPEPSSPGFLAAQNLGVRFLPCMSDSYWSTLDTMKDYIIYTLVPFFIAQRLRYNLPDQQRCILQIDCWSVHRSTGFRAWMAATYPWITLQYVPGGCTGLFQAKRSSDPAFYAEISSGASISLSITDTEATETAAGDEELSETTVHTLCKALLAANTAAELSALADTEIGNDADDSEDDYEPVPCLQPTPPPVAAASRRSTRVRRLTRR